MLIYEASRTSLAGHNDAFQRCDLRCTRVLKQLRVQVRKSQDMRDLVFSNQPRKFLRLQPHLRWRNDQRTARRQRMKNPGYGAVEGIRRKQQVPAHRSAVVLRPSLIGVRKISMR